MIDGPGPGAHKEVESNYNGKQYPVSAYKRASSPEWKPQLNPSAKKYKRVPDSEWIPGPGAYDNNPYKYVTSFNSRVDPSVSLIS